MKQKILIILSIISTLTVIGWMITDFFGGMLFYLAMYRLILIPLIITYIVTFIATFIVIIKEGIKTNRLLFSTHALGFLTILIFSLFHSELLKPRILLNATLEDDLSCINIVLRENGRFETTTIGMYGFTDKVAGKYLIQNDTIIFLNRSYSNEFIPDTVLIDKKESAIFFNKDPNGKFIREKSFANYFDLSLSEL